MDRTIDILLDARWVARAEGAMPDGTTVTVSTIFVDIGLPHEDDLFETMVCGGGPHNGKTWRCRTMEEAQSQHLAVCILVSQSFALLVNTNRDGKRSVLMLGNSFTKEGDDPHAAIG